MFTNFPNTFSTARKTGPTDMFRKISKLVFYQKLSIFFQETLLNIFIQGKNVHKFDRHFLNCKKDRQNWHVQLPFPTDGLNSQRLSQQYFSTERCVSGTHFWRFFLLNITKESIDGNPTSRWTNSKVHCHSQLTISTLNTGFSMVLLNWKESFWDTFFQKLFPLNHTKESMDDNSTRHWSHVIRWGPFLEWSSCP